MLNYSCFLSPCFSFHVAIVLGVYGASENLISEEFSTTLGGFNPTHRMKNDGVKVNGWRMTSH